MSDEEIEWLNSMQKSKYIIEDIIKYFMKNAKGRKVSELENRKEGIDRERHFI